MHFDLNDDQLAIRDTARALLDERSPVARVREAAEQRRQDDRLWVEICELGWAGIAVPEAEGGQGLGLVELCILAEEHGAALAPTPLLTNTCAAQLILRAGTEEQRGRWLSKLASGRARGAIGHTTGGDVVAGAPGADVIAIAETDGACLLDGTACDVLPIETIDQLRPYAVVNGLGEPLPGDSKRGRNEASVVVAAELLGVARRCLEMTVSYVKERRQFGVAVGSFQAIGHKCAEMLFQVESARAAVYYAAWTADAEPPSLPEAAAVAKYVASAGAIDVSAAAIQAHGGVGFTWECDIHWWYKRAQLGAQLLGGAGIHRARLGQLLADRERVPVLGG